MFFSARLQHGFTLIELVTTMLLVGILAVFAVGRLDFTSTFDQRATRDKLIAGLQFARKVAMAQRRNVCAAVASSQATFTLDTQTPETGSGFCNGTHSVNLNLPAADKSCSGTLNQICAPNGVTITASNASFSFDSSGGASATTTFSVTGMPAITCGDGVSSGAVCIEASTGYVHAN